MSKNYLTDRTVNDVVFLRVLLILLVGVNVVLDKLSDNVSQ